MGFVSLSLNLSLAFFFFSFSFPVKHGHIDDSEKEGTRQFMVNVIQPQFNLHSEEANVSDVLYVQLRKNALMHFLLVYLI